MEMTYDSTRELYIKAIEEKYKKEIEQIDFHIEESARNLKRKYRHINPSLTFDDFNLLGWYYTNVRGFSYGRQRNIGVCISNNDIIISW